MKNRRIGFETEDASQTVWQDAFGVIRGERRYIDDTPMIERWVATPGGGGELMVWADKSQRFNSDCPDNLAFAEMGLATIDNAMLDARRVELLDGVDEHTRSMDAADFRERCVAYNGKVYALYEKRAIDFQPVWFKRPEEMANLLAIPFDLAHRLVGVLTKSGDSEFNLNASMMNKLLRGHTTIDGEQRGGLMSLAGDEQAIAGIIDMLEGLNAEANAKDLDEGDSPTDADAFYDHRMIYQFDDESDPEQDDGFDDDGGSSELFGAFPLSDGTDGVEYDFIDMIKSADMKEIGKIQKMMFPSENAYTGRTYGAELGYLKPKQKSIVWAFIKDRKTKLANTGLKQLDAGGRQLVGLVKDLGKCKQAKAMISAWAAGNAFDLCGVQLEWTQPSAEAIYGVWALYRNL